MFKVYLMQQHNYNNILMITQVRITPLSTIKISSTLQLAIHCT